MAISGSVNSKIFLKLNLNNFLVGCFVCWPLFWNLWSIFKLPISIFGYSVPTLVLVIISGIAMIAFMSVKKSVVLMWIPFFVVTMLEFGRASRGVYINDIIICFCGVAFCYSFCNTVFKPKTVYKWLIRCGLFIAATVVINTLTGFFSVRLLSLYTSSAAIEMQKGLSGGILPYSGSAGCYLMSGLAAFYLSHKEKKIKGIGYLAGIILFIVSLVLIKKRSCLIGIAATALMIRFMGIKSSFKIRPDKIAKRLIGTAVIILAVVFIYRKVPFFKNAVQLFYNKFVNEDGTLSGRTVLYKYAYDRFSEHPILGIGWGKYRQGTLGIFSSEIDTTYEVHNIYLQVLCENGILGLLAFLTAVIPAFIYTLKKYRRMIKSGESETYKKLCQLSLYLQLFFLIYGTIGNPLYDYNFLITYFIGILTAFRCRLNE